MVRQSFSHGRTKPVVVEKKRRRISAPGEAEAPVAEKPVAAPAPKPAPKVELKPWPEPAADRSGMVLRTLTDEEKDARAQALADSRQRETEERRVAEEEARRRAAEDDKLRAERAEAE